MTDEIEVGDEMDVDFDKLSIPARRNIDLIDTYISHMSGIPEAQLAEIKLFHERWKEIDVSVRHQTDYNLTDHLYKGIKIVPWDGL